MTTVGVVNPVAVGEGDVELPTTESIVEVAETEPTEIIEPIETEPAVEEVKPTVFKVTAYCPCSECCGKSDGVTATGTYATQGRTIAVDPSVIPYGTEVIINGNTYVAEDCGGAIRGNRVDIYFDSHQEALAFGVQYLEGVIVE